MTTKAYFIVLADSSQYPYQLIHANRAKRLSIKLSSTGELSVILPQGMQASLAHSFVQKKTAWIEKHLHTISIKPKLPIRPDFLDLKMLNETWSVHYKEGREGVIEYNKLTEHCLVITGDIQSDKLIHKIIGLFLKNKANRLFVTMINEIAAQHHFQLNGVTVRGQKTRWGSCSGRKKININYKLLLMPEAVARYVFIHELCHTKEMNHSAKFWQLVKQYDPDYQQHRQYLKEHGDIIRYF